MHRQQVKVMQFTDLIFIVARQTSGVKPKSGGAIDQNRRQVKAKIIFDESHMYACRKLVQSY